MLQTKNNSINLNKVTNKKEIIKYRIILTTFLLLISTIKSSQSLIELTNNKIKEVELNREEIKIGASTFISSRIKLSILERTNISLIKNTGSIYLPSDIISLLPLNTSFDFSINQGYTNENEFIDLISNNKEKNSILDNFSNYSQNGISYFSDNFSPINRINEFVKFMEHFSNFFQVISSPLLDRTNYVINSRSNNICNDENNNNNKNEYYYMNEILDKPCVEVLDGIKNIFPKMKWNEFNSIVDYEKIAYSSFKNILFKAKKVKLSDIYNNSSDNFGNLIKDYNIFQLEIRILFKDSINIHYNSEEIFIDSRRVLKGKRFDFDPYLFEHNIEINPNILAEKVCITNNTANKDNFLNENLNDDFLIRKFEVIEKFPQQLELIFSSIEVGVALIEINTELESILPKNYEVYYSKLNDISDQNINNNKSMMDIKKTIVYAKFNHENINTIANLKYKRQKDQQNSGAQYTYESKVSDLVYLTLNLNSLREILQLNETIQAWPNKKYKIFFNLSFKLRKMMLNFESYENEMEFGFKTPTGLIVLEKKLDNKNCCDNKDNVYNEKYDKIFNKDGLKLLSTNQISFNIQVLDNTTPFTIIALTWVFYGFILIQMLNLFLNNEMGVLKHTLLTVKSKFKEKLEKLKIIFSLCLKRKEKTKLKEE